MLNELMYKEEIAILKNILKGKLDDLDIKIYQLLREDGRMSDTKIAEKLGVSITTVRRRRMRLQEEGILQIMALILLRAVFNPRIYETTEYFGGEYDLLLRFFESNPEKLKYHIDKFLREADIVEMYRIFPAIGSPKAWYRKFTLKF